MRQTLFYIPSEIFGIPVFGFGLVLGLFLFFILASMIWRFAITRKLDSELFSYLILGVVISFVIAGVIPNILEPQGFPIRGYGVCLLCAILSAIGLAVWLGIRRGLSGDTVISLGFWVVICGILGTRIFYVIEYYPILEVRDKMTNELQLIPTLFNIVNIANGGLVVIGGIIGGATGGIIFAIRNKLNVLFILDIIVPTVMLGISIGRIGCFLNGCCFGAVCDLPWAVTFPELSPAHCCQIERGDTTYCGLKFRQITDRNKNTQLAIDKILPTYDGAADELKSGLRLRCIRGYNAKNEIETYSSPTLFDLFKTIAHFQHETPNRKIQFEFYDENNPQTKSTYSTLPQKSGVLPVHPTQIYSSIIALTLCGILLILGKINWFKIRNGAVSAAFLILYGTARFCIEIVRTDEEPFFNTGLTIAQNLSIILVAIGLILLIYVTIKKIDQNKI